MSVPTVNVDILDYPLDACHMTTSRDRDTGRFEEPRQMAFRSTSEHLDKDCSTNWLKMSDGVVEDPARNLSELVIAIGQWRALYLCPSEKTDGHALLSAISRVSLRPRAPIGVLFGIF